MKIFCLVVAPFLVRGIAWRVIRIFQMISRTNSLLALICILGFSGQSFAQDAAKGEVIYRSCIECHGDHGQGIKGKDAPKIAGQFDWYIESSIHQFKSGERKNPTMLPFIKGLSDQDVKDVAAFVSKLTAPAEEK